MAAQHQQHQHRHHQYQPPQQCIIPDNKAAVAATTTIVPEVDVGSSSTIRQRTTYSLDDVSTSSAAAPARSRFLNPWRELDREDFVITYATKGTARCIACASKIGKGELQVSLACTMRETVRQSARLVGNIEQTRERKRS